jgi:hypothetical protein
VAQHALNPWNAVGYTVTGAVAVMLITRGFNGIAQVFQSIQDEKLNTMRLDKLEEAVSKLADKVGAVELSDAFDKGRQSGVEKDGDKR